MTPIDFERTPDLCSLSPREREVLSLACQALTNQEIGEHLGISGRTIEVYIARINLKLNARSKLHAALIAYGHVAPGPITNIEGVSTP